MSPKIRTSVAWLRRHALLPSSTIGAHLLLRCACDADGRFSSARTWTDRQWLAIAHLDREDVAEVVDAMLARWDGDDLVVIDHDGGAR